MDGIILIKKEKEYTSHDVVAIVKKILQEKVGHTGTLDPNATGILPLLIGKGTKISKYLINHDKTYQAVLKLGIQTDTADITGEIIQEKETDTIILEESNLKEILQSLVGKQEQYPPMYSAIKIHGKKLYEYARQGQQIQVEPRKIEIYEIKLDRILEKEKEIIFTLKCSKGTYIRTLCEEIAKRLGTIGCMKELIRLQVGEFFLQDAITITELEKQLKQDQYLKGHLITLEKLLESKERIVLDEKQLAVFLNGVKIAKKSTEGIATIYNSQNEFIGTGVVKNGILKRDVIV